MVSMYMDSSPTSMQSTWIRPLPAVLEHGLNIFGTASGYFNNNIAASPCMTQMGNMGGGGGDVFFGDSNGVLSDVANVGAESELFVPPLESISTEESFKSERIYTNSNYFNTTNPIIGYNNNNNIKAENLGGVGNCFQDQEEPIMGEWDLEDLMKDVSSFPFLDFQ